MNLFTGIICIAAALFVIYFAIAYQWLDKHRFSVERNYTKNKDVLKNWHAYASEIFKDDEKIAPVLERFGKERKLVKKVNTFNEFQDILNSYCEGNSEEAAEYKKIRKGSYDRMREFANVHNVLADEFNIKLEKEIVKPVIKILRIKEVPKIYLGTNVPIYKRIS